MGGKKKGGGGVGKAISGGSKKLGGAVSKVANAGPAGKLLNTATGGTLGAAGSILQGENPLKGTTVDQLTGGALGNIVGGSSRTGGGGGGGGSSTGPRPEMAKFTSALGGDGLLSDKYKVQTGPAVQAGTVTAGQLDVNALAADPRALDAMRERAMSQGNSPWLNMQLQRQGLEETSARDAAARQAMGGAAAARSQLAMRGGLGGGASTRIAMQSARDMNAARQGIGRAGQLDRLGLAVADDQTKMALLGQTANLDLSHAGQKQDMSKFNIGTTLDADKFNTGNKLTADQFNSSQTYDANKTNMGATLGQLQNENQFNAFKYGEDMKGYAAGKQGDAMAKGGKK